MREDARKIEAKRGEEGANSHDWRCSGVATASSSLQSSEGRLSHSTGRVCTLRRRSAAALRLMKPACCCAHCMHSSQALQCTAHAQPAGTAQHTAQTGSFVQMMSALCMVEN